MAKKKLKRFTFTYREEVKRMGTVEATSEDEARKKIDKGDYDEEHDVDNYGIDDICFIEEEEL